MHLYKIYIYKNNIKSICNLNNKIISILFNTKNNINFHGQQYNKQIKKKEVLRR